MDGDRDACLRRASIPVFARSLDQVLRPRRRHHGASYSWASLAARHGSRSSPPAAEILLSLSPCNGGLARAQPVRVD
jgi:hypothetical protein